MSRTHLPLWGAALLMLLASGACTEEDSGATTVARAVLPVSSVSGSFSLVGAWTRPCTVSGADGVRIFSYIQPTSGSYNTAQWAGDPACSGPAPLTTLAVGATPATQGLQADLLWSTEQPAGLGQPLTGTRLLPDLVGQQVKDVIYVDDTAGPPRAYTGDRLSTPDAAGYPTWLDNTTYAEFVTIPTTATLNARSVKGSLSLLGSWRSPCATVNTTDGQRRTYLFTTTLSRHTTETFAADPACGTPATTTQAHFFLAANSGDLPDAVWSDAPGVPTGDSTPPAGLEPLLTASGVSITYVGEEYTDTAVIFVDDSVSPPRLYLGSANAGYALDSTTYLEKR